MGTDSSKETGGSRPSWVTWFPVKEKLNGRIDDEAPLLVDVGGGCGHDLLEFLDQFPGEKWKYILQDQRQVLDSAGDLAPMVEKRAFNFFYRVPSVAG